MNALNVGTRVGTPLRSTAVSSRDYPNRCLLCRRAREILYPCIETSHEYGLPLRRPALCVLPKDIMRPCRRGRRCIAVGRQVQQRRPIVPADIELDELCIIVHQ